MKNGHWSHKKFNKEFETISKEDIDKSIDKIIIDGLNHVRLGSKTENLQNKHGVKMTQYICDRLSQEKIHHLIMTKRPEVFDLDLSKYGHIQIGISTNNDKLASIIEPGLPSPSERIKAFNKYQDEGDISLRIAPLIDSKKYPFDFDMINDFHSNKIQLEFLRINHLIKKGKLNDLIDLSNYNIWYGSYHHLPLEKKIVELNKFTNYGQLSVCEKEPEAYNFFIKNVNPNKEDCCNISI